MMFPALSLLSVLILGASTSAQLERVDPDVEVPSVSVDELVSAAERDDAPRVIDVRLTEDFDKDPVLLPDAEWRDPNAIEDWAGELSKNTPVIVYCVAGRWVSQSVTKKLIDMGFDVAQLTGGIDAWVEAGEPTAPAKKP